MINDEARQLAHALLDLVEELHQARAAGHPDQLDTEAVRRFFGHLMPKRVGDTNTLRLDVRTIYGGIVYTAEILTQALADEAGYTLPAVVNGVRAALDEKALPRDVEDLAGGSGIDLDRLIADVRRQLGVEDDDDPH